MAARFRNERMRRLVVPLALAVAALAAAVALGATPPVVETAPATGVGQTQATLTAKVDPNGSATTVRFDLGTSTSYGLQSATTGAGSGNSSVTVAIPVQGLTANTTYHYRVVATNAGGTAQGADATFTTAPVPPAVSAPSVAAAGASAGTPTGITILGRINPNGADTSWRVDYGLTTSYGSSTPPAGLGAGTSTLSVSQRIEGLAAGKRYHYRLVATNAKGTTRGSDHTFVTTTTPTSATLQARPQPRHLRPPGRADRQARRLEDHRRARAAADDDVPVQLAVRRHAGAGDELEVGHLLVHAADRHADHAGARDRRRHAVDPQPDAHPAQRGPRGHPLDHAGGGRGARSSAGA